MFPAPTSRAKMIGDFASDLAQDATGFGGAWSQVQKQLDAEGANTTVVSAAKSAFSSSFDSLAPHLDSIGGSQQLLNACTQYTLKGTTIGGAVDMVGGLISAAQSGTPAPQLLESFTGTMITVAIASGALTAGIGAAIVGAVTGLVTLLQAAGLFGGSPGVSIPGCPAGETYKTAPDWAIGCTAAYGGKNTPGSFGWRHFPNPGNPTDAGWFTPPGTDQDSGSAIQGWRGLTIASGPGLAAIVSGGGGSPLVDAVFPNFAAIDVEHPLPINLQGQASVTAVLAAAQFQMFAAINPVVADFHRAFLAAWKLNQEYALNGLTPQPDWNVLYHALNLWNTAHSNATTYSLRDNGATPLWEANNLIADPNTLSSVIGQSDPIWDPTSGGHAVIINTGPRKPFTLGSSFASTSATSAGKVVAYSAGGIALGSIALAAWRAHERRTTIARVFQGWGSDASRKLRSTPAAIRRLVHR